jgi:hypothetical protein
MLRTVALSVLITYMALGHSVPTNEPWLDLAALNNLYSGEIIGWAMDE